MTTSPLQAPSLSRVSSGVLATLFAVWIGSAPLAEAQICRGSDLSYIVRDEQGRILDPAQLDAPKVKTLRRITLPPADKNASSPSPVPVLYHHSAACVLPDPTTLTLHRSGKTMHLFFRRARGWDRQFVVDSLPFQQGVFEVELGDTSRFIPAENWKKLGSNTPVLPPAPPLRDKKTFFSRPQPGYVSGRVLSSNGRPLKGMEIRITGTTAAKEPVGFVVFTDSQGHYHQRLPDGTYTVTAPYQTYRYGGQTYEIGLQPRDVSSRAPASPVPSFSGSEGRVQDFIWHLSGLRPGEKPGDPYSTSEHYRYYGRPVFLTFSGPSGRWMGSGPPPSLSGATLQVTLIPTGPLMDGSRGEKKVFRRSFNLPNEGGNLWILFDIPPGKYKLSAQRVTTQGESPLLVIRSIQDYYSFKPNTAKFERWADIRFPPETLRIGTTTVWVEVQLPSTSPASSLPCVMDRTEP